MHDVNWQAYAVRYMRQSETRPARETYIDGRDSEDPFPGLDYFFWVLVRGGRVIVVDTGMSEKDARRSGREWFGSPREILSRMGISSDAVKDVLITHAHTDHVGNLDDFPNATFWIQKQEMRAATGEEMIHSIFRHVYSVESTLNLVRFLYDGRLRFLDGDGLFEQGLNYYLIGGHSRGQMVLEVATERGHVILSSDAVHLYEEAETERPFFAFHDLMAMLKGYRRCLSMAGGLERLVVGHDRRVTDAYPAVEGWADKVVLDISRRPDASKLRG